MRPGTIDHRAAFLLLGVVVAVMLMRRENPAAFLASIFVVTVLAWSLGASWPQRLISAPDFSSVLFKLDPVGALKLAFLPAIVSILFTITFSFCLGRACRRAPRANRRAPARLDCHDGRN